MIHLLFFLIYFFNFIRLLVSVYFRIHVIHILLSSWCRVFKNLFVHKKLCLHCQEEVGYFFLYRDSLGELFMCLSKCISYQWPLKFSMKKIVLLVLQFLEKYQYFYYLFFIIASYNLLLYFLYIFFTLQHSIDFVFFFFFLNT